MQVDHVNAIVRPCYASFAHGQSMRTSRGGGCGEGAVATKALHHSQKSIPGTRLKDVYNSFCYVDAGFNDSFIPGKRYTE